MVDSGGNSVARRHQGLNGLRDILGFGDALEIGGDFGLLGTNGFEAESLAVNVDVEQLGFPAALTEIDALHFETTALFETPKQAAAEFNLGNQFALEARQAFLRLVDPHISSHG